MGPICIINQDGRSRLYDVGKQTPFGPEFTGDTAEEDCGDFFVWYQGYYHCEKGDLQDLERDVQDAIKEEFLAKKAIFCDPEALRKHFN